jgi:hypothetical protein
MDNPFWWVNHGIHIAAVCWGIAVALIILMFYQSRHK